MEQQPSRERNRVVAFYGFKGGSGRSFLMANTAAILAEMGHRVLIIDADLEAPGLGDFLDQPSSSIFADWRGRDGLLDLLLDLSPERQSETDPQLEKKDLPDILDRKLFPKDWLEIARDKKGERTGYFTSIDLPEEEKVALDSGKFLRKSTSTKRKTKERGEIFLMGPGDHRSRGVRGPLQYVAKLVHFDWNLYLYDDRFSFNGADVLIGLGRVLRESEKFDSVLIDARTGYNFATLAWIRHLATDVVALTTSSYQSIDGIARMCSVLKPNPNSRDRSIESLNVVISKWVGDRQDTSERSVLTKSNEVAVKVELLKTLISQKVPNSNVGVFDLQFIEELQRGDGHLFTKYPPSQIYGGNSRPVGVSREEDVTRQAFLKELYPFEVPKRISVAEREAVQEYLANFFLLLHRIFKTKVHVILSMNAFRRWSHSNLKADFSQVTPQHNIDSIRTQIEATKNDVANYILPADTGTPSAKARPSSGMPSQSVPDVFDDLMVHEKAFYAVEIARFLDEKRSHFYGNVTTESDRSGIDVRIKDVIKAFGLDLLPSTLPSFVTAEMLEKARPQETPSNKKDVRREPSDNQGVWLRENLIPLLQKLESSNADWLRSSKREFDELARALQPADNAARNKDKMAANAANRFVRMCRVVLVKSPKGGPSATLALEALDEIINFEEYTFPKTNSDYMRYSVLDRLTVLTDHIVFKVQNSGNLGEKHKRSVLGRLDSVVEKLVSFLCSNPPTVTVSKGDTHEPIAIRNWVFHLRRVLAIRVKVCVLKSSQSLPYPGSYNSFIRVQEKDVLCNLIDELVGFIDPQENSLKNTLLCIARVLIDLDAGEIGLAELGLEKAKEIVFEKVKYLNRSTKFEDTERLSLWVLAIEDLKEIADGIDRTDLALTFSRIGMQVHSSVSGLAGKDDATQCRLTKSLLLAAGACSIPFENSTFDEAHSQYPNLLGKSTIDNDISWWTTTDVYSSGFYKRAVQEFDRHLLAQKTDRPGSLLKLMQWRVAAVLQTGNLASVGDPTDLTSDLGMALQYEVQSLTWPLTTSAFPSGLIADYVSALDAFGRSQECRDKIDIQCNFVSGAISSKSRQDYVLATLCIVRVLSLQVDGLLENDEAVQKAENQLSEFMNGLRHNPRLGPDRSLAEFFDAEHKSLGLFAGEEAPSSVRTFTGEFFANYCEVLVRAGKTKRASVVLKVIGTVIGVSDIQIEQGDFLFSILPALRLARGRRDALLFKVTGEEKYKESAMSERDADLKLNGAKRRIFYNRTYEYCGIPKTRPRKTKKAA